jgi:alkylated DNA nucleotide flippase Atl1
MKKKLSFRDKLADPRDFPRVQPLTRGMKRVTPYWRTLKSNGELNAKYPGGLSGQRRRLRQEGLEVFTRGDRIFVRDHERLLVKLR